MGRQASTGRADITEERLSLGVSDAAFVLRQPVGHLATADAAGHPHVVPVCFAYENGRFYIAIDQKPKRSLRLRRLRNIEENQRVALVFDHYDDDWSRLGWVFVQGSGAILVAGAEHERAVAALRERYVQYRAMALDGRPLIRVVVEKVSSWGELG